MPLPQELTTVTRTSKTLAVITFLVLPFIAFFAGMRYQALVDGNTYDTQSDLVSHSIPSSPTVFISPQVTSIITKIESKPTEYKNSKYNFTFMYPSEYVVIEDPNPNSYNPDLSLLIETPKGVECMKADNRCGLTHGTGAFEIEIYKVSASTDLRTWVNDHTKTWSGITGPTPAITTYKIGKLQDGLSYDDNVGLGNGTHTKFFKQNTYVIGFSRSPISGENPYERQIMESFHFE